MSQTVHSAGVWVSHAVLLRVCPQTETGSELGPDAEANKKAASSSSSSSSNGGGSGNSSDSEDGAMVRLRGGGVACG
eukprot:1159059-Pelagomonas_calceolata.AAC.4